MNRNPHERVSVASQTSSPGRWPEHDVARESSCLLTIFFSCPARAPAVTLGLYVSPERSERSMLTSRGTRSRGDRSDPRLGGWVGPAVGAALSAWAPLSRTRSASRCHGNGGARCALGCGVVAWRPTSLDAWAAAAGGLARTTAFRRPRTGRAARRAGHNILYN